jgi:hypothetical protein
MRDFSNDPFIQMPVPASMFGAVCALLGGVSGGAVAASQPKSVAEPAGERTDPPQPQGTATVASGAAPAASDAGADAGELDAGGWPWDASLHASTKGKTKDGFWRMKVGVSRPEPKPGFPLAAGGTGTSSAGTGSAATGSAASAAAGPATGPTPGADDDEDEFAAFRAAADNANATDTAAAAAAPARKWTDADLGALCNQAAVKLGDPAPIKAVIAEHVPQGQVPHSRNIPEASREAFAQAVEKAAGITFAG